MDQLLIERVKELECEVAEIAVASHAYLASGKTDLSEQLLHERRLERLQEINEELEALHQKQALTRQQEARTGDAPVRAARPTDVTRQGL